MILLKHKCNRKTSSEMHFPKNFLFCKDNKDYRRARRTFYQSMAIFFRTWFVIFRFLLNFFEVLNRLIIGRTFTLYTVCYGSADIKRNWNISNMKAFSSCLIKSTLLYYVWIRGGFNASPHIIISKQINWTKHCKMKAEKIFLFVCLFIHI